MDKEFAAIASNPAIVNLFCNDLLAELFTN
jgi:hypothetical protein